jgi:hypothetical protein
MDVYVVCAYVYMRVYVCRCVYVYMCRCVDVCMCMVYVYVYVYVYVCFLSLSFQFVSTFLTSLKACLIVGEQSRPRSARKNTKSPSRVTGAGCACEPPLAIPYGMLAMEK